MLLVHGRGEMAVLPTVEAVLLHTVLWKYEQIVVMLVHSRSEMAVLPTFTTLLLHYSAMDT